MAEDEETATARNIVGHMFTQLMLKTIFEIWSEFVNENYRIAFAFLKIKLRAGSIDIGIAIPIHHGRAGLKEQTNGLRCNRSLSRRACFVL
jgi:hypothetical protein